MNEIAVHCEMDEGHSYDPHKSLQILTSSTPPPFQFPLVQGQDFWSIVQDLVSNTHCHDDRLLHTGNMSRLLVQRTTAFLSTWNDQLSHTACRLPHLEPTIGLGIAIDDARFRSRLCKRNVLAYPSGASNPYSYVQEHHNWSTHFSWGTNTFHDQYQHKLHKAVVSLHLGILLQCDQFPHTDCTLWKCRAPSIYYPSFSHCHRRLHFSFVQKKPQPATCTEFAHPIVFHSFLPHIPWRTPHLQKRHMLSL